MLSATELISICYRATDLPTTEEVLAAGRRTLEESKTWKKGKEHVKGVKTCSTKVSGEPAGWYCRVSEHTPAECSFDEFWEKLGTNKGVNEIECVPRCRILLVEWHADAFVAPPPPDRYVAEVTKATLVKQISPSQAIWSMYYNFPPPVSPRVFTVLQVTEYNSVGPRHG